MPNMPQIYGTGGFILSMLIRGQSPSKSIRRRQACFALSASVINVYAVF